MTRDERETIVDAAREGRHRPPTRLTLDDEFAWAMEAIGHAQSALARLHDVTLDVARAHYPDRWRSLVPRLVSIASWVGYDHDGRSDIGWTDTPGEDATQRTFHDADDTWRAAAAARLPMGRLGQADEIADFVVFLLSPRSGVVTGSVIDWDQNVLGGLD